MGLAPVLSAGEGIRAVPRSRILESDGRAPRGQTGCRHVRRVTALGAERDLTLLDARGTVACRQQTSLSGRQVIDALPGGMVLIKSEEGT
jgi:hypothetical protein